MRARLLDATLACLVELGYGGTTTTEVVRRAGVSRGAQVHHFPTKQDLVVAAIEHVLERRQDEFRLSFAALSPEERTLTRALDLLWSLMSGPTFAAWLELALAARTDPELQRHYLDLERRFTERSAALFAEFFPVSPDPHFSRLGVEFAFAFLDGLALQRHVGIGQDAEELLEMLKGIAAMFAADLGGTP
jgi:AcrR family transcriptional regulator